MERSFPMGGSAALAVVLLSMAAFPAAADVITNVGAIPNPFSPNGDGALEETSVYYTLSQGGTVVVTVLDSESQFVRELSRENEGPGGYSHVWNGRLEGAVEPEPNGLYYFEIHAMIEDEVVLAPVVLDTIAPVFRSFTAAPSRFSPDGDGVSDSLFVSFGIESVDATDQVAVAILDTDGGLVAALLSGAGIDTAGVFWDGTPDARDAAPDTFYLASIVARDAALNERRGSVLVDLDTEAPAFDAHYTVVNEETLDVVAFESDGDTLRGWAYDRAGVDSMEISLDDTTWVGLVLTGDPGPAKVEWKGEVECVECAVDVPYETVTVHVRAYDGTPTADGHGHTATSSFDVVFDPEGPVWVSSEVTDDDNRYSNGETITISSDWGIAGYDVTADFGLVDSEYEAGSEQVADEADGTYTITYTISDENTTLTTALVRVPVTASEVLHAVTDTEEGVLVEVVEPAVEPSRIAVDRNSFDPAIGEDVTIDLGSASADATVDVYNMVGTLVRTLDAEGGTSVTWAGDNEDGEIVASGVYFLRIQTDDEDLVRKVAVVK